MDLLPSLARFILCAILILASLEKLFRPNDFEQAIAGYRLLPVSLVRPTARMLPWVELACAILLGIGMVLTPVTWLVIALLTVFAVAMGINLIRGRASACGCGVWGDSEVSWWLVGRNIVLIGLAVTLLVRRPTGTNGVSLAAMMTATTLVLALSVGRVSVTTLRRTRSLQHAMRHGGWAP